jgi:L-rhamnose mutarotase
VPCGRSCSKHCATPRWRNYSLFLRDDGLLIGYAEADDLDVAQEKVARTEVNARWQAAMSELFQSEGAPDEAWEIVPEVFNLEDQLRAAGGPHPA